MCTANASAVWLIIIYWCRQEFSMANTPVVSYDVIVNVDAPTTVASQGRVFIDLEEFQE